MEIINKIINKFGNDKVLHFLTGGLICSFITFVVILQEQNLSYIDKIASVLTGTIDVFVLSFIKEVIIDTDFNWKDILASIIGCVPIFIAVCIGVLFNYLSL